jgi:hypothetical protein
MGRPSSFTQEIADEICARIAKGESLRSICSDEDGEWMPGLTTVRRWLSGSDDWNAEFRLQYAHAREDQGDFKFDQAWDLAASATAEDIQVKRLQVDTVKWQAAKLAPKKYGDKVTQEHVGEGGGPISVAVKFV